MKRILILALVAASLGACSWGIKLDSRGKNVRTAWNNDVSGCREVGKVTVSVLDRVGPVDRKDIKVRDELEVMARNEAGKMDADTIRPLGEPREGEQTFASYVCGSGKSVDGSRATRREDSKPEQTPAKTETYPIK
ncbi:MAG: DUF4156 domain-containing protein [Dokdonella sp.]